MTKDKIKNEEFDPGKNNEIKNGVFKSDHKTQHEIKHDENAHHDLGVNIPNDDDDDDE